MKSSMNMMWGCVAVIAVVIVLAVSGAGGGYLVFAVGCALMMGAMMWMMMGGPRGRSGPPRGDD